jgi:hypothetical protein
MNAQLWGSGTGNGGKDFDGLGNLVPTAPSSDTTTGKIDASAYSWWRNQIATTANASLTGLADMRTMFNNCTREGDMPNLIICSQNFFEWYESIMVPMERIAFAGSKALSGDAGFQTLTFKGKPITWDADATANTAIFLNTDYLKLRIDPDTDFTMTEWRVPVNQMSKSCFILLRGNMVMNNRALQGRLTVTAFS